MSEGQLRAFVPIAIFLVGGVAILVASFFSRAPRALWSLYGLEVGQVSVIVAPALAGSPWVQIAYVLLAGWCVVELATTLRRSPRPSLRLVHFCAFAALIAAGFSAWAYLALVAPSAFLLGYTVIELNDTLAWAVGSAVGRHRVWPALSPNKTWEGLLGGLAGSLLVAATVGAALLSWSPVTRLVCGAVLFVAGTAGDLLASALKRSVGVKDFGALIPRQGGVLDLYDSFVLAGPVWLACWASCES